MGPKTFLGKPKRFGWRASQNAVAKAAKPKSPRSFGYRVSGRMRERIMEAEPPRVSRNGYLLAPCLVLWAAVWGTRAAYYSAMEHLPFARSQDFQHAD